jgi:hypothetical protein
MKNIYIPSFLFIFLASTTFAGTVNLPKTGQTKCYDSVGTEISCAGTGQDGEIQAGVTWLNPRFKDNGDGTMTDTLTGLMWSKGGEWRTEWQQALDYVTFLNSEYFLGYTDWHLPNVNELESLVNINEADPADWLNRQGFTYVFDDYYWSSTTCIDYTSSAWAVNMSSSEIDNVLHCGKSSVIRLLPVRAGQDVSYPAQIWKTGQTKCYDTSGKEIGCFGGGQQDGTIQAGVAWPNPRFTDHGNGIVTDNLTGLMWTKDANLPNSSKTWQQALDYVKGMNIGTYYNFGYTDWRLPNRKELYSLNDFSQWFPSLPSGHPFTNLGDSWYWSSSTRAGDPSLAWVAFMWKSNVLVCDKSFNGLYVWPVRGGKVGAECSTWTDVILKYDSYVSDQASWSEVITCYNQYVTL